MSPDIARSSASPPAGEPASHLAPSRPGWRTLLCIAAGLAYPFLVYWVLAQRHPWFGLVITLAALAGLCALLPQGRARVAAALVVVALAAVASAFAATSSLLFLPPLWVNLGLAWLFGHTLAPGREALITRFARLEHAAPAPQVLAYTRRLTWVWTVFFLSMATISGALAATGAHAAWVWFTAVGNWLCVAVLFAIEYGYRRWRFPGDSRVPPGRQLEMLRAALRDRPPSASNHRNQGP
jgi:uncharacterized membrane protein